MTTKPNMQRLEQAAQAVRDAKARFNAAKIAVDAARTEHRDAEEALSIATIEFDQAAFEEFELSGVEGAHV